MPRHNTVEANLYRRLRETLMSTNKNAAFGTADMLGDVRLSGVREEVWTSAPLTSNHASFDPECGEPERKVNPQHTFPRPFVSILAAVSFFTVAVIGTAAQAGGVGAAVSPATALAATGVAPAPAHLLPAISGKFSQLYLEKILRRT